MGEGFDWANLLAAFISALLQASYHKLQVSFYNERLNTMTICPSHRAKLGIVSSRSCSTRGRVPGHGKEKESGQKVKEDWGKRDLKLSYAGLVRL